MVGISGQFGFALKYYVNFVTIVTLFLLNLGGIYMALVKSSIILNLKEFSDYIGANASHMGRKMAAKDGFFYEVREGATKDSDRFYKGLKLPLPICGDFFNPSKRWHLKDVQHFQSKLRKIEQLIEKLNLE